MLSLGRNKTWWKWMAVAFVGGAFALSGCQPEIRDTLLSGLQDAATGLASTFLDALFIRIRSDSTALAPVVEQLAHLLA